MRIFVTELRLDWIGRRSGTDRRRAPVLALVRSDATAAAVKGVGPR